MTRISQKVLRFYSTFYLVPFYSIIFYFNARLSLKWYGMLFVSPAFLFDSFNTIGCCWLGIALSDERRAVKRKKNANSDSAGNYELNYIGIRMKKYPRQFPAAGWVLHRPKRERDRHQANNFVYQSFMKNYNRSIARVIPRHEVSIVSRQIGAHVSSPILSFRVNSFYQEIHLFPVNRTNGERKLLLYICEIGSVRFYNYFQS